MLTQNKVNIPYILDARLWEIMWLISTFCKDTHKTFYILMMISNQSKGIQVEHLSVWFTTLTEQYKMSSIRDLHTN